MQLYNVTPYGAYNTMPAEEVVGEILGVPAQKAKSQLSQMLEHHYCWYTSSLKAQALEVMEALILAYEIQLPVQIRLSQEQLINLVTQDMAARFHYMAKEGLGYTGSIQVEPYGQFRSHSDRSFRIPITTDRARRTEWVFDSLEEFRRQIPLHALKAITMFRDQGLKPDAYWVADKVQTVIAAPRSLDPILCAQFGHWFAGIAMWL